MNEPWSRWLKNTCSQWSKMADWLTAYFDRIKYLLVGRFWIAQDLKQTALVWFGWDRGALCSLARSLNPFKFLKWIKILIKSTPYAALLCSYSSWLTLSLTKSVGLATKSASLRLEARNISATVWCPWKKQNKHSQDPSSSWWVGYQTANAHKSIGCVV